ncbi:MAG: hypothetical protein MR658_03325 [Campylobacter sp.]|uniref:hypothetical protein n=1 Tax=Campylobacter sp. TaxID=205 RepID=UPI002A7C381D|nr:hypothetical protein [Campylobacter sp.]MCI6177845.1 hypothetical protein [Campylobacter sp.]MDD7322958.1 hypothetical protein [Campylobacteraceae bacterium]MDY2818333.1 hypothetical protein [Campylobacter lanienae]
MFFFLALAIVMAAVFLLMPTPTPNMSNSSALNNFDYPTNSNGRAIPELFGTAKLSGNVIWCGDLRSKKIEVSM